MNKISVLHITVRPQLALKVREQWLSMAEHPERIEYLFCFDELNPDLTKNKEVDVLRQYPHVEYNGYSLGVCKKSCLVAEKSTGKIMIQSADSWKAPKHWDTMLDNCANWDKPLALWVNNMTSDRKDIVAWIMSRSRYEQLGYWQNPEFIHLYADDWHSWLAKQQGVVVYAPHIVFTAMDNVPNTINDERHQLTNSPQQYEIGRAIFERLKDEFHSKQ